MWFTSKPKRPSFENSIIGNRFTDVGSFSIGTFWLNLDKNERHAYHKYQFVNVKILKIYAYIYNGI